MGTINKAKPKKFAISQPRGDTWGYKFQRFDFDGDVIMDRPDEMYFTVKNCFHDKDFVIQKTLADMYIDEEGFWHFTITADDTNNLAFGVYDADVERIVSGDVKTLATGTFTLTEEVTYASNEKGANNA